MQSFPPNIRFSFPWRSYQKKVLEELESHLDDNHLNIVAAPGSGKTILGLEAMLRINKPTLILAPSIAIKNQWVARFVENFLQVDTPPEWISTDIKKPKFLTVSTYQGLHAAFAGIEEQPDSDAEELTDEIDDDSSDTKNEDASSKKQFLEAEKILKRINENGIKTLVIDEAHHLRNAWWKSLIYLNDHIEKAHVIALTATPPYDVAPHEWQNYQYLCGSIDAEISVPELVLEKNLCPHQDFVYLNSLSHEEEIQVKKFRDDVKEFVLHLEQDTEFIELLKQHPFLLNSEQNIEAILEIPEYFSSILIFLDATGQEIPADVLKILGTAKSDIPSFSLVWAEILLENFLYKDDFFQKDHQEFLTHLKRKLQGIGAIEKRKVFLQNNAQVKRLLKESLNKLNSILEIVKIERQNMGQDLRMVILTDFIRKDFFQKQNEKTKNLSRIGVIPIFEKIRREFSGTSKIGILSGSMVLIPKSAEAALITKAKDLGIPRTQLKISALPHTEDFLELTIKGEAGKKIVYLMTEVFSAGEIEILVGTKSLLGEGWDAPSVNTLVLASFVGSFMLSNQMRGRAIRIDEAQPNKISNIWHLASIEKDEANGGHDFETLQRRFKSFVGIAFEEDSIENGFERMATGKPPFTEHDLRRINGKMEKSAINRNAIKEKWEQILQDGEIKQIIPELKLEKESLPRDFVFYNTIRALFWRTLYLGGYVLSKNLAGMNSHGDLEGALRMLGLAFLFALFVSLPGLIKVLYLFLKNGPIDGNVKQIGTALVKTLCKIDAIKTDVNKLRVIADQNKYGAIFCGLEGGTTYEKSVFLDSLEEILNPIQNPRYILTRKSHFKFLLREDFHTVPQLIGVKKEWAEFFALMWSKHIGENTLIYTRNIEGRKALLKARQKALSTRFQKKSERLNTWK